MSRTPSIVAAVAASAALLAGCGAMGSFPASSTPTETSETSPDTPYDPEARAEVADSEPTYTPPPELPDPEDFKLEVTILSKDCYPTFGECDVTFRVTPTIVGGFVKGQRATIVYKVEGATTGVKNSFALLGNGQYRGQQQEMATTPIPPELSAEVVDVLRG